MKVMPKPVPVSVLGIKHNKVQATHIMMPRISFSIVRAAEEGSCAGTGAGAGGDVASCGAEDALR